jgi:hypothetical protein
MAISIRPPQTSLLFRREVFIEGPDSAAVHLARTIVGSAAAG